MKYSREVSEFKPFEIHPCDSFDAFFFNLSIIVRHIMPWINEQTDEK